MKISNCIFITFYFTLSLTQFFGDKNTEKNSSHSLQFTENISFPHVCHRQTLFCIMCCYYLLHHFLITGLHSISTRAFIFFFPLCRCTVFYSAITDPFTANNNNPSLNSSLTNGCYLGSRKCSLYDSFNNVLSSNRNFVEHDSIDNTAQTIILSTEK